ncbi:unnamed protein product [Closterium sp. Naga37s-1]|nr:unnamed protein product [Closterium sp. Naga37s-1]
MVDYLVMGFGLAACGGSLCGGVLIAFDSHAPEKLKLSHLLIFPLPQSPPWRLLHLSPIPLAQQAEDAEPIRNGESLMDPPCLHRISRPSHGAAHSSGGATRPSLTGSRPASAPIRTDRPEAQPTARMPPANHGDERKETRHVASAGHRPHPTRSRSYVSSPAELQDAKPLHSRSHTPPFPPSYQPPHAPDFPPHAPPRCPPSYPPSAFPNRPAGAPICPPAQRQQGGPGEQTAHRQLEQGLRTLPRLKAFGKDGHRRREGEDASRRCEGEDASRRCEGEDASRRCEGEDASRRCEGEDASRCEGEDASRRCEGEDASRKCERLACAIAAIEAEVGLCRGKERGVGSANAS